MKIFLQFLGNKSNVIFGFFFLLGFTQLSFGQKTWTGATNNNWSTTTNWSPTGLPSSSDAVTINAAATVVVDITTAVCASVQINNSTSDGVTTSLTISSGRTLTVGSGGAGAVTIGSGTNMGNGNTSITTLTVSGNLVCGNIGMSPGARTVGGGGKGSANLTINSTGIVTVTGNVAGTSTSAGALGTATASVIFSGAGLMKLTGSFTTSVFTASTGTVEYNNAGTQTIRSGDTYNNLTISGSNTKTAGGALDIAGNLLISTATFAAGTSLTHNIQGNWTNNGVFSFVTGSTINFNGNNALQTISGSTSTAFNNITVNKGTLLTNTLEATGPMSMTGTATFTNGTFKLTSASASGQYTGGNLTLPATGGLWVNGGSFSTVNSIITTSGSLVNCSSGTLTVGSAVNNRLEIVSGSTLTMSGGILNIVGRLYNNGGSATFSGGTTNLATLAYSNGTNAAFEMTTAANLTMTSGSPIIAFQNANSTAPGSSTTGGDLLILSGAGTKNITNGTFQFGNASTPASQIFLINSNVSLSNITVNATNSPIARPRTNPVTLSGNVTLNGGTYDLLTNSLNTTLGGDWTNNGGTFSQGTGVVTFSSTTADQNINGTAASQSFIALTVNKSGRVLNIAGSATSVTVTGTLTLTNGSIDLKGQTLILNSAAAAQSVAGSGSFTISSSVSGGIVRTTGSGSHTITVSGFGTSSSGGLIIGSNTTLQLNSNAILNCGGNGTSTSMVTMLNKLLVNGGSIAASTAPFYGSSSTLEYAVTSAAGQEWLAGSAITTPGVPQNVTVNGSGITLSMPTTDRRLLGDLNITLGTLTLNATSGNLYVAGNFSRSGTFTPNGRTVNFNGTTAQSISGATTFSNIIDSNTSNALTLSSVTTISNNLSIATNASLNLTILSHTAGTLTLGGSGTPSGSWGGTASLATNQSSTYFASTAGLTGIITVGTGSCPGISATISGTDTICNGGSSNFSVAISGGVSPYTLVYTGGAGGTVSPYTSGTNVAVSPSTTTTYNLSSLTTDSNRCPSSNSGSSVITVNAVPVGPVIAKNPNVAAVCVGATLTISVTTAGTGGIPSAQDEYRYDNGSGFTAWSTSIPSFAAVAGTNTVESRRFSTGSGCTTAAGNTVSWTVNAVPVGPVIAKTPNVATLCAGSTLTISVTTAGSGGAISSQDEYRYDNGSGFTSWSTSIPSFAAVAGTNTVESRRFSTGSGCTTAAGNTVSWTVNAVPVGPVIAKNPNVTAVCAGATLTISVTTAGTGGAISSQDEYRYDNGSGFTSWSTSIPSFAAVAGTNTVESRRFSTGSGCTTAAGNTVSWTVNAVPVGPVIAKIPNTSTGCAGTTLAISVTTAGTGGAISSQDEYRYDTGLGFTSWSTSLPSFTAVTGTNTIESRRTSTGSGCTTAAGNTVSWTVGATKTYSSGAWSPSAPTSTDAAIISSNYSSVVGDITACALTVNSGAVVTIPSGNSVTLDGALTISSGSFTLENNAYLLQTTSVSNTDNITVNTDSSSIMRLDYTLWSSPVTGQGLYAFSPYTFSNRFYQYLEGSDLYNANLGFTINPLSLNSDGVNGTDSSNITFDTAKGYLIRVRWDHPTAPAVWHGQFTGVPNNGDKPFALENNFHGYNAVGNPYPSPISITSFLGDNSSVIFSTLWFWRKTNNPAPSTSYVTYSGGTYSTGPQTNYNIQPGQGFIVQASTAGTLLFKNTQRVATTGHFFRSNAEATTAGEGRIWLNLIKDNLNVAGLAFGYKEGATNGLDEAFDGKYINDSPLALTSIVQGQEFAVQHRAVPFSDNDVVPLSFKTNLAGTYSIEFNAADGVLNTQDVYLEDLLLGQSVLIKTTPYTFTSDVGNFPDRFRIVYLNPLGVPTSTFNSNQVIIYKNDANDFVVNSGNVVMASIKVFDIRGRLLLSKKGINASETTMTVGSANEVLLVQIKSEDGITVIKKVIR